MALSRKKLREILGNEETSAEEKAEAIMKAHTDTVDGLKDERDTYREAADRLQAVENELKTLREAERSSASPGDGGFEKKYNEEHAAFEAFKNEVSAKEARGAKEAAYRALLVEAGVDPGVISTILRADRESIDAMELDDGGKIKDASAVTERINREYAGFRASSTTVGVPVANPQTAGKVTLTKADIMKIKDPVERQTAMAQNIELFR